MKNFLEYYYNLININVHEKDNYYYFNYNNNDYLFINSIRTSDEIISITKINNSLKRYHKIILNRNNIPITIYNNKIYVLLKLSNMNGVIDYKDLYKEELILNKESENLLRNDWVLLFSKKIDYIEYQREHIKREYPLIDESLDYYIGLSENSISYLNDTVRHENSSNTGLVICHKRITNNSRISFYNPLNIVIDHVSRDISEYLKLLFINDTYDINTLRSFFNSFSLNRYEYRLLFGRMLYPSFYFDIYESVVNSGVDEKNIISVIKRSREYEAYLRLIYDLINSKIKIPSVDWI